MTTHPLSDEGGSRVGAMPQTGTCRACGASMLWAKMPSGRLNPLNVEQVPAEVGKGVVAYNPRSGNGMPVTFATVESCAGWAEGGITFHTSHFSDCPERGRFGRDRDSEGASA